jgi:hypothetical protein
MGVTRKLIQNDTQAVRSASMAAEQRPLDDKRSIVYAVRAQPYDGPMPTPTDPGNRGKTADRPHPLTTALSASALIVSALALLVGGLSLRQSSKTTGLPTNWRLEQSDRLVLVVQP